jgi:hypothetical protein
MKNQLTKSRWTFVAIALIVVFIAVISSAGAQDASTDSSEYEISFTKWGTCYSEEKECETADGSMVIWTMEGVVTGGDAGTGSFSGEVLEEIQSTPELWEAVPVYHIHGTTHEFSAHMLVMENPTAGEATLVGIITDGWLKGQTVKGTYTTVSSCEENPVQPPDEMSWCVQVTLHIHEEK